MNMQSISNDNNALGMAPRITVTTATPIMSKQAFCESTGLRAGQLRGQIDRERIHLFRIGGKDFVNVARYVFNADSFEGHTLVPAPLMTAELFAQYCDSGTNWVRSKMGSGEIPAVHIGRLKMVDMAELFRMCLYQKPVVVH